MRSHFTFKRFSLKAIRQTVNPRWVIAPAICCAALTFFALTVQAQDPAEETKLDRASAAIAAAEVSDDKAIVRDSAFLAANPELLKVQTTAFVRNVSDSTYLAANPELSVVRRYSAALDLSFGH
ncbi:MAG: hypothetical protein KDJ65_14230 [Anaerolineae bacterium]|nr:hypothetical protein [Anaerolineae bacterium]